MTVFELMATLGLDTNSFEEGLDAAKTGSTQATADIEKTFDSLDDTTTTFDTQLKDLRTRSDETSAIMEGVSQSIGDIVGDAIEGIIEFGKQSIEAAASTGSELADAFNESRDSFNQNLDIFKEKAGSALLPIMTWLYDVGSAMTGIDDTDRLNYLNRQLDALQDMKLEGVRQQLEGVFGLFEQVDAVETGDVSGFAAGLQSQADYWTDYAETLENLKNRDIDAGFLAEIADGSVQSLATLKSLEGADATALEEITSAYEAVQAAKESAATGLNETQLQVDTDLKSMVDDVAELVAGMDKRTEAYQNALATGGGVVDGLAEQYPAIAAYVDSINAKLAEIGYVEPKIPLKVPSYVMDSVPYYHPARFRPGLRPL